MNAYKVDGKILTMSNIQDINIYHSTQQKRRLGFHHKNRQIMFQTDFIPKI